MPSKPGSSALHPDPNYASGLGGRRAGLVGNVSSWPPPSTIAEAGVADLGRGAGDNTGAIIRARAGTVLAQP